MGGCAGKFKGSDDLSPEPLPSDAPVNPDQAEGETVAKEQEVGEIKTEAPLVDVSEQKHEGEKPAEPEIPAAEPEKKDETPAGRPEDKVEAAAAPEKKKETPPAKETENKESDVAPTKEANKETPPVTV
ncbi:PREDICTED: salt stress root protein RS1-like [Populus euphratica]|uniref:Salt stress root protein RS1-like n=1 Tax=Populus euphratica TaxID=75702 RepID=A0AAJ6X2H0_POPEU|nr:PREDICTED: salt stress root protein RS1-like [Populus euphratica]